MPRRRSSRSRRPPAGCRSGWAPLRLRELWTYRELLYCFTWRDVKVRCTQTVLGIAWAVLQPFMQMVVFTIFFGRLGGMDQQTGSIPYEVYSYAGLLPWTFFANAVGNGANSLVGSANLITKVCFPRLVIPLSALTAAYRDFRCVVPRDGTACPGRWSGSAPPGSRQRRSTPAA